MISATVRGFPRGNTGKASFPCPDRPVCRPLSGAHHLPDGPVRRLYGS